jgi:hypothetical protein
MLPNTSLRDRCGDDNPAGPAGTGPSCRPPVFCLVSNGRGEWSRGGAGPCRERRPPVRRRARSCIDSLHYDIRGAAPSKKRRNGSSFHRLASPQFMGPPCHAGCHGFRLRTPCEGTEPLRRTGSEDGTRGTRALSKTPERVKFPTTRTLQFMGASGHAPARPSFDSARGLFYQQLEPGPRVAKRSVRGDAGRRD